jgi:hypothetical protein
MQAHGRAVVEPNKKRKKKTWASSNIFLLGNRFFLTPDILRQGKQYCRPRKALNQCWGSGAGSAGSGSGKIACKIKF